MLPKLLAANAQLKKEKEELENDVRTSVSAIQKLLDDIGIDVTKLNSKKDLSRILPTVIRKIMFGSLNFTYLDALSPFLEKYNHLIKK